MSGSAVWPDGYGCIIRDSCGSTNAEALRLAPTLSQPTWIMARRQTAARGRRGRSWESPVGNFAATLAMRPTGTAGWAALRSFMAANALFEALALHVKRTRLSLKWPNDVLLDGGKVAGILLESASLADRIDWLCVGIGVNLKHAPEDVRDAAFPPVAVGRNIDGDQFLTELAGFYATEESILMSLGFEPIREKWLRNAARLGEVITARTGDGEYTGRFVTVDGEGRLVLETSDGEHHVAAADVYF